MVKRRRHRAADDILLASLREGEILIGDLRTKDQEEPPIILWIDDEPLIAFDGSRMALREPSIFYAVTSEEEIIDLVRQGLLPVHRLACIVQDMTRPIGSLETTLGRYRRAERPLFPIPSPSGDLGFYLRDQFYPMSSLVFFSGVLDSDRFPVVWEWTERASNVFGVVKPLGHEGLTNVIQRAVDQFTRTTRPRRLSEEARWLLPVAEELTSITAVDATTLERMSSRQFEEMIASILANHGFNVALTQQSRDGGYDLKLLSRRNSNTDVVLVECKKYNFRRCVGVGIVRSLYGVKALNQAGAAWLVTSSYISPYAKREFVTVTPVEMRFFERTDVLDWCREHLCDLIVRRPHSLSSQST